MSLDELENTIVSVSRGFHNAKRLGIETEDFAQEFRLWCWRRENEIDRWFREDEEKAERRLRASLINKGRDMIVDYRVQVLGHSREEMYFYTTAELQVLLEAYFDRESWTSPPVHDEAGGRAQSRPAEGGNWLASLCDVGRAYKLLAEDDALILRRIHGDGLSNGDLAHLMDSYPSKVSYYHKRALTRLQRLLGGEKPKQDEMGPWMGRTAMSNAQARAITHSHYESDISPQGDQ